MSTICDGVTDDDIITARSSPEFGEDNDDVDDDDTATTPAPTLQSAVLQCSDVRRYLETDNVPDDIYSSICKVANFLSNRDLQRRCS